MRLLVHPELSGPLNMAVDWWLLREASEPVLRFYGWNRPTLTVGYRQQFQPPEELSELMDAWPVAIRPTGGGYLLHAGELTYSVTVPSNHPLSNEDILGFYGNVREALTRALPDSLAFSTSETGTDSLMAPDCLEAPGAHEPVLDGAKWMASAQVRQQGNVLQHGSIYLFSALWPSRWTGSRPVFLGDHGKIVRDSLRNQMIGELVRLIEEAPVRDHPLTEREWRDIVDLEEFFSMDSPDELPVFRRGDCD